MRCGLAPRAGAQRHIEPTEPPRVIVAVVAGPAAGAARAPAIAGYGLPATSSRRDSRLANRSSTGIDRQSTSRSSSASAAQTGSG